MINNKSDNTCKSGTYNTNYLLFIDDANEFLGITGLERNKEKSVIKYTRGKGNDTLLEGVGVYKYSRIIEHIRSIPTPTGNIFDIHCIEIHRLEPADFCKLDDSNNIHLHPACKEFTVIELKSKNMLLKLMDCLETSKEISTRRLATLKRKILLGPNTEESWKSASMCNDEDGVYEIKTKNIPRLISKGVTTLDGLIINISEESNLEEEKRVVQEAE
ncbi:hypothetical protein CWI38_0060p0040 [Hamiltosporidium tvaerminnensis]|uniref:Uncharacterized protein n=1 Tax=Hamiltosporidium tvaerminnensis TaxID=1176355 RepID=A0A4Q9M1B9_9MICR|nr:hypothetical protein CWI38_0060p0040 [Hamiltosporidium tvaerminnensis]